MPHFLPRTDFRNLFRVGDKDHFQEPLLFNLGWGGSAGSPRIAEMDSQLPEGGRFRNAPPS